MKDNKFKITKAELQQIIKEEYASMAKDNARAEKIKARLSQINEELETLPETLSEVEASGTKKVKATGWTGKGNGDEKYGEKFEKIGTHLKEDEELEGDMEMGGDEMEAGAEMGGDEMEVEIEDDGGYFEMKFAELGKELDDKIGGEEEGEGMAAEMGADMGLGSDSEEEVEVEEIDESVAQEEVEDTINEDLEEPIEGETPAQDSDARFNDYMEKDKHVKEGTTKVGTTLLSEGFTSSKKSALDSELERMKRLAKL